MMTTEQIRRIREAAYDLMKEDSQLRAVGHRRGRVHPSMFIADPPTAQELSMVKMIVEDMGLGFDADSEAGKLFQTACYEYVEKTDITDGQHRIPRLKN